MPNEDVSRIVEELNRIGAKIPDFERKCRDKINSLFYEYNKAGTLVHAFLMSPAPSLKKWDRTKLESMREVILSMKKDKLIPDIEAREICINLEASMSSLDKNDWYSAASEMAMARLEVEHIFPEVILRCGCATKGGIVTAVQRGIDDNKDIVSPDHCNIIWQDTIAALNRRGILTSEEADNLVKTVRW